MTVGKDYKATRAVAPSLSTSNRTHRHREDLLRERGPLRDATTVKYEKHPEKSERAHMKITETELKRRWPSSVLRPRVTVRRNDGGLLRDTAETMVYSLQQLMEFASKELKLFHCARRLFSTDGNEILELDHISTPTMDVVVSMGEGFKPPRPPQPPGLKLRKQPIKWRPYTVGAAQHPTPSDKKRLNSLVGADSPKKWSDPMNPATPNFTLNQPTAKRPRVVCYKNDGGHSTMCAAFLVYTFPVLLEETTKVLQFPHAARRIFLVEGQEIMCVDEIQDGMELVISLGENFRPRIQHRGTLSVSKTNEV